MGRKTIKSIYLVDDDPDDREIFAELLHEAGPWVDLRLIESGAGLMQVLCLSPDPMPDVILLDINMPLKDGLECLKEIRDRADDVKNSKIIMYSASGSPRSIAEAKELGADFYAVKPWFYRDLKSLVQKILEISWDAPRGEQDFRLS